MRDSTPDPGPAPTSGRPAVMRMLRLTGVMSAISVILVVGAVWAIWGLAEFSWHGLVAMVLTVFGVTAVNVGLIWLMRLSHMSGRDAEAYEGEAWAQARKTEERWEEYR